MSKGLNAVLGSGCPDVDGGIFFSPFPGLDWVRENVPEFFAAGQQLGVPTDDLAFALWSLARVQHELFKRYEQTFGSTDLTREDFVRMVEQPAGGRQRHLPAAELHARRPLRRLAGPRPPGRLRYRRAHRTLATFASGF